MADSLSLPFSGIEPIARHHSYEAAKAAATTRARKSLVYLEVLKQAGEMGLTDHQAAAITGWPLQTICSVRNGCGPLIEARTDARGVSPFGKFVTLWRRRA